MNKATQKERRVQYAAGNACGCSVAHIHVIGAAAQQQKEQDDDAVVSSFEAKPSRPVRQMLSPLGDARPLVQQRLNAPRRGRQARPCAQAHIASAPVSCRRAHLRPELVNVVAEPLGPLEAGDWDGEGLEQHLKVCIRLG